MINYIQELYLQFIYGTKRNDRVKFLLEFDFIIVDGSRGSGKTFLAEKLRTESGNTFEIFEEKALASQQIDYEHIRQLLAKKTPCILITLKKLNFNIPTQIRKLLSAKTLKVAHVTLVDNRRYKYGPLYVPRKFK